MNNGPVASEAKRVAEERLPEKDRRYSRKFVRRKDNARYISVSDVDDAVLSKSDFEALDFAWKNFGHYTQFDLAGISHHYPEWKRHAAKLRHEGAKRVEMDYCDFFADPDVGYNPCHTLSGPDKRAAVALYREHKEIRSLWH